MLNKLDPRYVAASLVAVVALASIPAPDKDPKLSNYQQRCAVALGYFVTQIPKVDKGQYTVTLGEAHRPEWVAAYYAKQGLGIKRSLHIDRLAVDLMLFERGVYQTDGNKHKQLADLWLTVGPAFGIKPAAGFYFNDGNHYSCEWQGRK